MSKSRIPGILVLFFLLAATVPVSAQEPTQAELLVQVRTLFKSDKKIDAIPLLEKLIAKDPDNDETQFLLGDALLAQSIHISDAAQGKAVRKRARDHFQKALDLGGDKVFLQAMIDSIPPDGGSEMAKYSKVPASDAATLAGEKAFTTGKIDDALAFYKRAVELDPKNYFAALFAGDMYLKKDDFPNAEIWYQKAIGIDPFIETAYRYSATPLMRQEKYDKALERYIEAWITEPYNRFAVNGMIMWARATGSDLEHPSIDVPKTETGSDGKPKTTINLSAMEDGSLAWIAYTATRATWEKEKFKRTFPNETAYRRSLAEEADALRSVVRMARSTKPKNLHPQILLIEEMDKDGVLEAFILMSYGDEDIHGDHRVYLTANREKMRQYVRKYVIRK